MIILTFENRMQKIELLKSQMEQEQIAHEKDINILKEKIVALNASNERLLKLNEKLNSQMKGKNSLFRNKEKIYPELIESVHDIMYQISSEGTFTFISSTVKERLGFVENEIIGRHFTDLVLPAYKESLHTSYNRMINERIPTTYYEFPVRAKNGNIIWIGQTSRLIENNNLVAVARDITDRKIAEDSLNITKSRFASLIANLQKGILVEDENMKIILVNQLFCDIFKISDQPDTLIGRNITEIIKDDKNLFKEPENYLSETARILENKKLMVDEKLETEDGSILLRTFIPIFLENHFRGHLWEYTDITKQYNSQELIRKSEEKYRGILNSVEMGLVEVDNNQTIVRAYDRFCKMVGYSENELVGKNAKFLFLPDEYDKIISGQQLERLKGNSSSYELQLRKKDGSLMWTIISGVPILGDNGQVVGSMGIFYDINERKDLINELEKAQKIAEDARQFEKQFLANMSHEIRTPLNAIIGMTHLLFDTSPTAKQDEYLHILKTSADFLLNLVSDLLDMAKIESGKIEVQNNPFDLIGLLKTTKRLFEIKVENRPIEISLMIDERISENYIGDNIILNQILLNIIGNAEKFTEKGLIEITVKLKKQVDGFDWIEFRVEDTGNGIPTGEMDTVFQKFKQINAYDHKGMGLGLSIAKQLVDIQGGSISVKSEEGIGSTFIFVLPYKKSVEKVVSMDNTILGATQDLKSCRVLVAEDNITNQKYISKLLDKWEIKYVIANDGSKAVEQAQQQAFDIILMDIQMPNMDGNEAAVTIRNTENFNQMTPIIALTASAMPEQKKKAMDSGMNDFLTKPFVPNDLLNTLQLFMNTVKKNNY